MSSTSRRIRPVAAVVAALVAAAPLGAQVVTYAGHDPGFGTVGPTAAAAQAAFLAATGGAVGITFEAPLPAGVGIAGGSVTTVSGCAPDRCGFNTTPAGAFFLLLSGSSATFTFATPIDYFGAYFGGVQLRNTIDFVDGSGSHSLVVPFTDIPTGGMSFAGFTDAGAGITSITIDVVEPSASDIISVDDVIFGTVSTVPEPATWALLATGLAGLGVVARRRRSPR